ncbi:OmpA family protein [Dyella silvatica]|uniref:OmpA family protein n=1 Tax=Dyella silvatica TaxID=2992128 RepID=UPI00224FD5C8|nr:OmpA family protein [Dyella silvatica]
MHKNGNSPGLDSLRRIRPGMNKQQLAALIGYPHFDEGVWGVHEWNYLFNLSKKDSGETSACQYKVLFDDHQLARSFYWKPESCAALLKRHEPRVAEAVVPKPETFTLSGDVLFGFDKFKPSDIKPNGRQELDALAAKINAKSDHIAHIQILGYTDELGSDAYNNQLSTRRADTVKRYLDERGVPSALSTAEGRGKSAAVKTDCPAHSSRAALIACLAPNRRVEVVVDGK